MTRRIRRRSIAMILTAAVLLTLTSLTLAPRGEASRGRIKILHIMSYHSPWKWTDEQLDGFKAGVQGVDAEYRVFQMDTKRRSGEEEKRAAAAEARALIDAWKPDLVYTTDDDVQELVTKHYVGTSLPFVFSGVNADPEKYGFAGSRNVTGVLEREHVLESIRLMKEILPRARNIAVIVDDGPMWERVTTRMKALLKDVPDVRVTGWYQVSTFAEYKTRMKALEREADMVALLGIFTYKDEQGRNVPYQDVLKWTAEHSRVPDFSFWRDRITYGTLAAVTVSEYEQGLAAGKLARAILVDGRSADSLPMKATVRGEPVINLARAHALGLKVRTTVLLTASVVTRYAWEK